MLRELAEAFAGCNTGCVNVTVLAYADDVVLCAPTWRALQYLINLLAKQPTILQLTINSCKTVFPPKDKIKIISKSFHVGWEGLKFV